jgi:S-sulfo-L-cysteine synthase (3-phospho-L-serine-dependent)
MPTLIIIEALGSGNGLALVRAAVGSGAEVIFAIGDAGRYAYDVDRDVLADPPRNLTVRTGVATTDPDALIGLLSAPEARGAGVIAQVDRTVTPVAVACEVTGHAFLGADAARLCSDKAAFRARMSRAGLPGPRWAVARQRAELAAAADRVGVPAVVKPSLGTGSLGVKLAWTRQEIIDHGAALLAQGTSALVEEYLLGPLVSAELFQHKGTTILLGLTDRVLSDPPYFAELGWTFPLDLAAGDRAGLSALGEATLGAVGFDRGPAHVEFVCTAAGPLVVEVNPRMAGRGLTPIVSRLSGRDEYAMVVAQALDDELPAASAPAAGYQSEWVVTGPAGSSPAAAAIDAVTAMPGILQVRLNRPATAPHAFGTHHDLGEVRAAGTSFAEAQMRSRAGAQALAAALPSTTDPAREEQR